jgi:hypothetical protein
MTEARTAKEAIYDEQISPLMAQIIKICRDNCINMAASFSLDFDEEAEETLFCSTVLPIDESDETGMEKIEELRKVIQKRPEVFAFTIHSGGK